MDDLRTPNPLRWLIAPPERGKTAGHLWPRWIFLRLLGIWFFSAFYSLWFQAPGLIGPRGILPAKDFLAGLTGKSGFDRIWETPTLLWWGTDNTALLALCALGLIASLLLIVNVAPRAATAVSTLAFLSYVAALQRFASYQSDGMLMEAGLISCFFAPRGWRPELGATSPPSRLSLFALLWVWFRIYFESGWAKYHGRDPEWLGLTAMDHYYETGPLPTGLSWYAQQLLPHSFHAATAWVTLVLELFVVWAAFLPRWAKIPLFFIVTPFQIGIILTANYAFLNYLVLSLGILLLDDRFLKRFALLTPSYLPRPVWPGWLALEGFVLGWQVYATTAIFLVVTTLAAPDARKSSLWAPVEALRPSRVANSYGLFGHMTHGRFELEFQGTTDGVHWVPYPFRYKPQAPGESSRIYAPYQPRFEWNLWFASLAPDWHRNPWVIDCAAQILKGSPDVLALFRFNPFPAGGPTQVRVVRTEYWFTTPEEHAMSGDWWRLGSPTAFGPVLERREDGEVVAVTGE